MKTSNITEETPSRQLWFVVVICFAMTFMTGGILWTFGVFFKPIENDFGWSRTLVSSGYTLLLLGHATSVVIAGRLVDRHHPRLILLVSALLIGLGISLCSQAQSINQLRFFFFLVGLGSGANWTIPTTTVQRWFNNKKRAKLALAIVVTGVGVGALVFAPLNNYLILHYGWRNAYIIVGIIYFCVIALLSFSFYQQPKGNRMVLEREEFFQESDLPRLIGPTVKLVFSP